MIEPWVVVVDDGELEEVVEIVRDLEVPMLRRPSRRFRKSDLPSELLITTGRIMRPLPGYAERAGDPSRPVWVCVHNQDFLPLRERLRSLGVNYLVNSRLDAEAMRLLIAQLLYRGRERRAARRMPAGCEISFCMDGAWHKALLAELSPASASLVSAESIAEGAQLVLRVPAWLTYGSQLELTARVLRTAPSTSETGEAATLIAVEFEQVPPSAHEQLQRHAEGEPLGSPLTPLEEPPARVDGAAGEPRPTRAPDERRVAPRSSYERRVPTLGPLGLQQPQVVLGCDLSQSGMRVAREAGLELGGRIRVALHGLPREEPIVVEALVVRDAGDEGYGLQFAAMDMATHGRLARLLEQLPPLESLDGDALSGPGLVVSQVLR